MADWDQLSDTADVVQRLHEAALATEGSGDRVHPASPRLSPPREGEPASLEEVLARRHAAHAFSRQPVEHAAVSSLVAAGLRADAELFPGCAEAGDRIGLHLLAWRLEGLDAGIYRWAATGGWMLTGAAPDPDEASRLVLQAEFAEAACLILITGSLAASAHRAGVPGYRDLLLRAGAVANTMWLEATRLDLGACIFAGMIGPAARAIIGQGDALERQQLALAVGLEADGELTNHPSG